MWAMRDNITAYDAGYVALAETLDVPLLTRPSEMLGFPLLTHDRRLSNASGHAARIQYID
jgi:predicted nucleic acid-binding protein